MKRSVTIIGMALVSVLAFVGFNKLGEAMDRPAGFDPATVPDPVEYAAGIDKDTTMFTVDGAPVEAERYLYMVGYAAELMQYYQFGGSALDWTVEMEGKPLEQFLKERGLESIKTYQVVENQAEALDCGLTREQAAEIDRLLEQTIQEQGGDVAFEKWLLQVGLSREGYERIIRVNYFLENLQERMEKEAGPLEEGDVAAYIEENDILRAKHILLMTMDPVTGEPLPEEEKAAKKAEAEEILAELQAAEDLPEAFDRLMNLHSEDSGLATNPDGYTFTAGQMVKPFEEGTRALEYGQLSGLVESDFGYHIILRLDPATEELKAAIQQQKAAAYMDEKMDQWMEDAQVETTEAYEALDVPAYLENLNALRAEIAAQDAAALAEQAAESAPEQ